MANRGKNTNGSQFFVTTQQAPHLDGLHVVFGEVISGQEVIRKIEHQPTNEKSRPYNPCTIANCGELVLVKKTKKLDADDLTSSGINYIIPYNNYKISGILEIYLNLRIF